MCLCDRQAEWEGWHTEQKILNVRDRQAALHLATILSPLPGQFTKSEAFSVVYEAGEMEREGAGEAAENRQNDNR